MVCCIISGWIVPGKCGGERGDTVSLLTYETLSTWHLEVVIISDGPGKLNRVIVGVGRQEDC